MCPVCLLSIVLGTATGTGFTALFTKCLGAEIKAKRAKANPAKQGAIITAHR